MKNNVLFWIILLVLVPLYACAGPNHLSEPSDNILSSFLLGLLHGVAMLFALIGSFFESTIGIYDISNGNHAYDLGYVWGALLFFGNIKELISILLQLLEKSPE